MMTEQDNLPLEINNISKKYTKTNGPPIFAVQGISFKSKPGEIVGILGSNGAGKTTLIKMICGIVLPTSGAVRIFGCENEGNRKDYYTKLNAVLEGNRNVYWRLSVIENVLYFGQLYGQYGKKLKIRAEQLLKELNIWTRRKSPVRTLSRGMQQKVAIASAFISNPQILLLDEPTLGLDIETTRILKEWILVLARKEKRTIIITTHQIELAEEVCERICIMHKGQFIVDDYLKNMKTYFTNEDYNIYIRGAMDPSTSDRKYKVNRVEDENKTKITFKYKSSSDLYDAIDYLRSKDYEIISINPQQMSLENIITEIIKQNESESDLHRLNA